MNMTENSNVNEHTNGDNILSPFKYECKLSKFQYAKMLILTVLVLPFRVIAFTLTFLITLLIANIFTLNYDEKSQLKPITDYRRWFVVPVVKWLARLAYIYGGFHWISFKGKRATREEAPILVVAPHSSYLDSLIIVALGFPSVVGKTESAKSFVGGFLRLLQPILVDRENPDSRKNAVRELNFRARSADGWPQIVIFPEGTCTNRTCIASFKLGAFNPGVPIQPIVVRWQNRVDCVTWVSEGPSVLKLLWLTFSQFHNRLEIEFLPVYTPNKDEQLDAQLFAENVRRLMSEYLKIPLCNLSYDDFCRMRIASKCQLPKYEAIVYLNSLLHILFSPKYHQETHPLCEVEESECVRVRLEHYLDVARSSPQLSQTSFIRTLFAEYQLCSKEQYFVNLAFKHYKDSISGHVNFREFMIHTCMLLFPTSPEDAFYYATKVFDPVVWKSELIDSFPKATDNTPCLYNKKWKISSENAIELLNYAFKLPNKKSQNIVSMLCENGKQANHSNSTQSDINSYLSANFTHGINYQQLYKIFYIKFPTLANCYATYDNELCKVFGSIDHSITASTSISETSSSTLVNNDPLTNFIECVDLSKSESTNEDDHTCEKDSKICINGVENDMKIETYSNLSLEDGDEEQSLKYRGLNSHSKVDQVLINAS